MRSLGGRSAALRVETEPLLMVSCPSLTAQDKGFWAPERLQQAFAPLNQAVTPSQLSPYLISDVQHAVTQRPLFNLH